MACAWEWLEKCSRERADDDLLALALVRMSIKFEFAKEQSEKALKYFSAFADETTLHVLESRLISNFWGLSEYEAAKPHCL